MKVDGGEYNDNRFRWDWHALPGVTEELRTDQLPKQIGRPTCFNPNHFAGTASNGRHGLAAFQYASDDPYTSAAANKGYFFTENYVLALGNSVRRVRNTDHSDDGVDSSPRSDQAAWDSTINYRLNGAGKDSVIAKGADVDTSFASYRQWLVPPGQNRPMSYCRPGTSMSFLKGRQRGY